MNWKNSGDCAMNNPSAVRLTNALIAAPLVSVGRMNEHAGSCLLMNFVGSGMMRFDRMGHTLQLQSPKQLRIHSHDHSGSAHGNCTDAHGQINSPPDEKASCNRDGDNVISW